MRHQLRTLSLLGLVVCLSTPLDAAEPKLDLVGEWICSPVDPDMHIGKLSAGLSIRRHFYQTGRTVLVVNDISIHPFDDTTKEIVHRTEGTFTLTNAELLVDNEGGVADEKCRLIYGPAPEKASYGVGCLIKVESQKSFLMWQDGVGPFDRTLTRWVKK